MGWLEKNFVLHERGEEKDEDGTPKLIPIDYPVPELGGKLVTIIPMTRGELLDITSTRKAELSELDQEQNDEKDQDKVEGKVDAEKIQEALKRVKERNEFWDKFVLRHLVKPKFKLEELKDAKLIHYEGKYKDITSVLLDAIYTVSAISSITEAEGELKKK